MPAELLLVRRRASGAEVHEGRHLEVRPNYLEELANRGISMEYSPLAWRPYVARGTDLKTIPTLEERK